MGGVLLRGARVNTWNLVFKSGAQCCCIDWQWFDSLLSTWTYILQRDTCSPMSIQGGHEDMECLQIQLLDVLEGRDVT